MPLALQLDGVVAGYGKVEVLHGVSMSVPESSVVALLGPNGAGKTTTLRVISGTIPTTSGVVRLDGRRINGRSVSAIARCGICLIPEGRGIFPSLSVRDNIAICVRCAPGASETGRRSAFDRIIGTFPRLGERLDQAAGTLSGGEQQMLALSRALVAQPRVLMMDEISMGLAPIVVDQLYDAVAALRAAGTTILLVEQYLTHALKLADICYVLSKGEVEFVGEPRELEDPEVVGRYLGSERTGVSMEHRDDALEIRVSDTERDRVVDLLKSHLADGRLSVEEFSDRAAEAYAAKTVGDLQWVLRELPHDARIVANEERAARRRWRGALMTRLAFANGVSVGVWALSGGGYFWPVWVLFGTGVVFLRRVVRGPRPTDSDDRPALKDGRVLTTCLFVDVVGSTELAAQLGDARWSELLRDHHREAHRAVTRSGGHEIFTRGDELVAGFDSASRAVTCARDIRDSARVLGLEVRVGLHAGEVHRQGNDVSGIALHIGQRVSALAEPGEILVSSTVRDMATGSGLEFESRGEASLKGVPGTWVLYAVID